MITGNTGGIYRQNRNEYYIIIMHEVIQYYIFYGKIFISNLNNYFLIRLCN